MKHKFCFLPIVFIIIFLVSCETSPQKQEPLLEENGFPIEPLEKISPEVKEKEEIGEMNYSLEQLIEDINKIADLNITSRNNYTFIEDKVYSDYYNGNGVKFFVIQKLDKPITTHEVFYEQFSAQNWFGGRTYFSNATSLSWLQPLLKEDKFRTERSYREYIQDRALVEQTTIENTIEIEEGKVLEYQFINWIYNDKGYFKGSWEETLLIYKIYCSPDFVVFIRPTWEKLMWSLSGAKSEQIHQNWNDAVTFLRPSMLNISSELLKRCPVSKEFFNDLPSEEFKTSQMLAYHYTTDLEYYWNFTTDIYPVIEPSEDEEGKYLLKKINVTFTNKDYTTYGPWVLDIETMVDNQKTPETFASEKKIVTVFLNDDVISRTFAPIKDEEPLFSQNITVNVKLYDDNGRLLRPTTFVFDVNGKQLEKRRYY